LSAAQNPANIRCEVNEIDGCNRETWRKCARLPILLSEHGHLPVQQADILSAS
jgi:hypothetical protein